ncbi:hypothetical protein [Ferrimonas balearica]|uniref:hypothetical protein n=1 Tax=Ferrimonas balearica TaxID=44012 RepID=UPI001C99F15D|nr:hypothetical protein [Ferrimonas balearica]MBY5992811.1 hypothetical protein [Ferrimonas balearica]
MSDGVSRHHRWLHPRQLPYLWVGLLCLLLAPAVGLGLLVLFGAFRAARWWQRSRQDR